MEIYYYFIFHSRNIRLSVVYVYKPINSGMENVWSSRENTL